MKTIGHHTCKLEGDKEFVLKNAPFKSMKNSSGNYPFLGEGYYFWDNNIEIAHHWGETHCKKKYYIVETKLKIEDEIFLDLVGNRTDMINFAELHKTFSEKYNRGKKYPIGKFIEVLRDLNKKDYKGIFPWKVCRAIDLYTSNFLKHYEHLFVYKKENYTNLSPRIVICLYEKNNVILQSQILVHPN